MRSISRHVWIFWTIVVLCLAAGQVMHARDVLSHDGPVACADAGDCATDSLCCHSHEASLPVGAGLPPVTFSSREFSLLDDALAEGLPLEIEHPPQLS